MGYVDTGTARAAGSRLARAVLAVGLLLGASACSGDEDDGSSPEGSSASTGTDAPSVATLTTVESVSGRLDTEHRNRAKEAVSEIVDQWFDEAFLGDFPRPDYSAAFAGFTEGAQVDALKDLDVMSNQGIADSIDTATAINRRVRLNLLAPKGRPAGATARFVLAFRTTGELEGPQRLTGSLYLTKQRGEWHVFGYNVLEVVSR